MALVPGHVGVCTVPYLVASLPVLSDEHEGFRSVRCAALLGQL